MPESNLCFSYDDVYCHGQVHSSFTAEECSSAPAAPLQQRLSLQVLSDCCNNATYHLLLNFYNVSGRISGDAYLTDLAGRNAVVSFALHPVLAAALSTKLWGYSSDITGALKVKYHVVNQVDGKTINLRWNICNEQVILSFCY